MQWVNGGRPRLTFGARHSAPSKVVPPSERLKRGELGGGGGREKKQSPPISAHPLPARSHSIASVSAPLHHHLHHPRDEEDARGTGGISAAMKDRMQELRHVSWGCNCCRHLFGGIRALRKPPRKAKQSSVWLPEQQLWFRSDAHI